MGRRGKFTRNAGMLVLSIWLILTGLLPFLPVQIPGASALLSVLAMLAGMLILMGR